MPQVLAEILARKREDLRRAQSEVPESELRAMATRRQPPRDFALALRRARRPALIAEVKRASPSKGALAANLDAAALAVRYQQLGASAVSVLTEAAYFRGSLDDLAAVKSAVDLPVLRKDFLLEPYQIVESRAHGADAVLLIVSALGDDALAEMLREARSLGMEALVEAHDAAEVEAAVRSGARVVGINNRDLRTFEVSLGTTERLRQLVPPGILVVSESGIAAPQHVANLRAWGVDAMLVGEALVTAPGLARKMRELLS